MKLGAEYVQCAQFGVPRCDDLPSQAIDDVDAASCNTHVTHHTSQVTRHASHVTLPALATKIHTPSGDAAMAVASACCELKLCTTYGTLTKRINISPSERIFGNDFSNESLYT